MLLRGLPSKTLKTGSLQLEFGALLMYHTGRGLGKPLLALFKFLLTTPFIMKRLVQSHSNSPNNQKRNIFRGSVAITQVGWCDVPLALCNSALTIRSLHLAHAIGKGHIAQQ